MLLSFKNYLRCLYLGLALASLSSAYAEKSDLTLNQAAFHGDADVVRSFLNHGANIHERDASGWMPLHNAVYAGNMGVPEMLLAAGADVNALTTKGMSALQLVVGFACEDAFKHFDEREAIFEKLLNEDEKQGSWKSVYCASAEASKEATVRALIRSGAEVNVVYGETQITPLILAARRGATDLVHILITEGHADVNARCFYEGAYDASALYVALKEGHIKTAEVLIEQGADIHAVDSMGKTLLHSFVVMGQLSAVQLLVEAGADLGVRDWYGDTPLGLAEILAHSTRTDIFPRERYEPIAAYLKGVETRRLGAN